MGLKVIITGATGMVGEGVMLQCLKHPSVDHILLISRRPGGFSHPKVLEKVVADMADITSLRTELEGYDACFFCLGVTSVGKKEPEYTRLTFDLTMGFATTLQSASPGLTFCYVSGSGTDGTEKGRIMWARVKAHPSVANRSPGTGSASHSTPSGSRETDSGKASRSGSTGSAHSGSGSASSSGSDDSSGSSGSSGSSSNSDSSSNSSDSSNSGTLQAPSNVPVQSGGSGQVTSGGTSSF